MKEDNGILERHFPGIPQYRRKYRRFWAMSRDFSGWPETSCRLKNQVPQGFLNLAGLVGIFSW
jgi:hypothetical protein